MSNPLSEDIKILTVEENINPLRIDRWLANQLPELSRNSIKKLIDAGKVLRNQQTCQGKTLVHPGDTISIALAPSRPPLTRSPQRLLKFPSIAVLFEDKDIIVIDKPAGISVHPGAGTPGPTVVDWLVQHYPALLQAETGAFPDKNRPGIVHRLDKDTSGALVMAKTPEALNKLAEQFRSKSNRREYVALLDGVPSWQQLTFKSYLARHPQHRVQFTSYTEEEAKALQKQGQGSGLRYAESHLVIEQVYGHRFALARVSLATGRTHQIRVHCKAAGFPLWGDPLYNRAKDLPQIFPQPLRVYLQGISRQLLHAERLGFIHPRTKEAMDFRAPLPADFADVLQRLEPYRLSISSD